MTTVNKIWKNYVDSLKQEELAYELRSRGLAVDTVVKMRSSVRSVLNSDFDSSMTDVEYVISFSEDADAVSGGIDDLETLAKDFNGDVKHNSFRRLSALLSYLLRRVARSEPVEGDESAMKNSLLLRLLSVRSSLERKVRKASHSSKISLAMERTLGSDSDSSDLEEVVVPRRKTRSVPVAQWNLKFSGSADSSVSAFLERVDELRVARNISLSELFDSAIDLFIGDALLWYRSMRSEVDNWEELVKRIRRAFMPSDYDDQLTNEIYHRLQGVDERPTLYVAAMRRLYQRLSIPPPATEQLKRVLKNLHPKYSRPLALANIDTFPDLLDSLEKLEELTVRGDRFGSRSLQNNVLEPDLACKKTVKIPTRPDRFSRPSNLHTSEVRVPSRISPEISRKPASVSRSADAAPSRSATVTCWNCNEPGHMYPKCSLPRKRFCYRCGRPNVLVSTCLKCRKRWRDQFYRSRRKTVSPVNLISATPFQGLDTQPQSMLDFILGNASEDERPFLSVEIFGINMLGLLDSGASRTILGSPGWSRLRSLGVTLLSSKVKCCTVANGENCKVIGVLCIPIVLQKQTKLMEVFVVPSVPHCLILGVDFWKKMGIVPDLRSNLWKFSPTPTTHAVPDAISRSVPDVLPRSVPDALSRSVPALEPVTVDDDPTFKTSDKWYITLRNKITSLPDTYPDWRVSGHKIFKYVSPRIKNLEDNAASWRFVVPKDHRTRLLKENHDLPTAGHLGTFKTCERLAINYYWPKMKKDVYRYVRRCPTCSAHKVEQKKPAGLMAPRARPTRPWQILCIDIVGPLPRSRQGNCYVLVIADCFTKYANFFAMRNATASKVAKIVEENIFLVYGTPQYLIADNGVQFRSREFTTLCEKYRSKILFNARYHPQANPAERINRVLKTMLSSYVGDNQRDWDKYLAHIGCAIRTAKHEITNYTPYFANYGREHILYGDQFNLPLELNAEVSSEEVRSPDRMTSSFERLRADIVKRLNTAYLRSKKHYDLRRRYVTFKPGDKVWKHNYVLSSAADYFSAKLAPKFIGPFTVAEKLSPWTYRLENAQGVPAGVWHVKDLKSYHCDDS